MRAHGSSAMQHQSPLTASLDGGEWSASRHDRFNPEEWVASTTWIGGRVGPRDGSGILKTRKISCPCQIRILSRPVHSFINRLTTLPRLPLGQLLFHIYIQTLLFLFWGKVECRTVYKLKTAQISLVVILLQVTSFTLFQFLNLPRH
jgi:hypothetical protein